MPGHATLHELSLVAQEHVLGHGQAVEGALLLNDDGGTVMVRVNLVLGGDPLPVQLEAALPDGDDAREHVRERGLAGTVLTDERVDLSLVEVKRDVIHGMGRAKPPVDAHRTKHDVVCHDASSPPT